MFYHFYYQKRCVASKLLPFRYNTSRRDVQKNQELCELLPIVKTLKNANSENFSSVPRFTTGLFFGAGVVPAVECVQ